VSDPDAARFELRVGTPEFLAGARAPERARATRLQAMHPHPMGSLGVVHFETAQAGRVSLGVFDVEGRRVRTLAGSDYPAGLHEIAWRGDDDRGAALVPGIYWMRLEAAGRSETRKVVKVR
jgi:hypothetical protein